MAQVKDIFNALVQGPASMESTIPGIPKLSVGLSSLAQSLPPSPTIPTSIPGSSVSSIPGINSVVPNIIQGVEESIPSGLPKISTGTFPGSLGGALAVNESSISNRAWPITSPLSQAPLVQPPSLQLGRGSLE